jgi:hypothetical protein
MRFAVLMMAIDVCCLMGCDALSLVWYKSTDVPQSSIELQESHIQYKKNFRPCFR